MKPSQHSANNRDTGGEERDVQLHYQRPVISVI